MVRVPHSDHKRIGLITAASRRSCMGARFSKIPKSFFTRKAIEKCHKPYDYRAVKYRDISNIYEQRFPLYKVTGLFNSLFLRYRQLKMALRARKVSGAFEKRALGHLSTSWHSKQIYRFHFVQHLSVCLSVCLFVVCLFVCLCSLRTLGHTLRKIVQSLVFRKEKGRT